MFEHESDGRMAFAEQMAERRVFLGDAAARARRDAEDRAAALFPGRNVRLRWMPDTSGAEHIVDAWLDHVPMGHPEWSRLGAHGLPVLPWCDRETARPLHGGGATSRAIEAATGSARWPARRCLLSVVDGVATAIPLPDGAP